MRFDETTTDRLIDGKALLYSDARTHLKKLGNLRVESIRGIVEIDRCLVLAKRHKKEMNAVNQV